MLVQNEIKILLLLNFLLISTAHSSGAFNHAQCVIDYNLGNYQQALSSCSNALSTTQDEQVANYILGEIYGYGKGVAKDEDKAIQYYLKSATAGYPPAQLVVGHYYSENGNADAKKSIRWYLRAGSAEWEGAAYALSRAADVLYKMGRKYDAYKCLYASEQLGYKANENSIGQAMILEERKKGEKDVHAWLKDRKGESLVNLCEKE